jgi:hypothetical protein
MCITPCSVHNQCTRVLPNSLCECLGSVLDDDIPPSNLARHASIEWWSIHWVVAVLQPRYNNLGLEAWFANLTLDRTAVDGKVAKIREELLGTVLGLNKLEQIRCIINESRPGLATDEDIVGEETEQEGDVGFDTSNTELDEGTKHLPSSYLIRSTTHGNLDEQTVIVGLSNSLSEYRKWKIGGTNRNLGTSKSRTSVESNTITPRASVHLDLTRVRLEVGGCILSGNSALDREASLCDVLLGKTKLRESSTSCDLNLSSDNIDSSDFL